MPARKHLILAAIVLFGACGDVSLSRGMKDVGNLTLAHWTQVFPALLSPWVLAGIALLIGFLSCYLTALSFADLTFVLPATAVGYILLALLARFFLHEQVSLRRWIGIVLIAIGVGFVTRGPSLTERPPAADSNGLVTRTGGEQ